MKHLIVCDKENVDLFNANKQENVDVKDKNAIDLIPNNELYESVALMCHDSIEYMEYRLKKNPDKDVEYYRNIRRLTNGPICNYGCNIGASKNIQEFYIKLNSELNFENGIYLSDDATGKQHAVNRKSEIIENIDWMLNILIKDGVVTKLEETPGEINRISTYIINIESIDITLNTIDLTDVEKLYLVSLYEYILKTIMCLCIMIGGISCKHGDKYPIMYSLFNNGYNGVGNKTNFILYSALGGPNLVVDLEIPCNVSASCTELHNNIQAELTNSYEGTRTLAMYFTAIGHLYRLAKAHDLHDLERHFFIHGKVIAIDSINIHDVSYDNGAAGKSLNLLKTSSLSMSMSKTVVWGIGIDYHHAFSASLRQDRKIGKIAKQATQSRMVLETTETIAIKMTKYQKAANLLNSIKLCGTVVVSTIAEAPFMLAKFAWSRISLPNANTISNLGDNLASFASNTKKFISSAPFASWSDSFKASLMSTVKSDAAAASAKLNVLNEDIIKQRNNLANTTARDMRTLEKAKLDKMMSKQKSLTKIAKGNPSKLGIAMAVTDFAVASMIIAKDHLEKQLFYNNLNQWKDERMAKLNVYCDEKSVNGMTQLEFFKTLINSENHHVVHRRIEPPTIFITDWDATSWKDNKNSPMNILTTIHEGVSTNMNQSAIITGLLNAINFVLAAAGIAMAMATGIPFWATVAQSVAQILVSILKEVAISSMKDGFNKEFTCTELVVDESTYDNGSDLPFYHPDATANFKAIT